MIMRQYAFAGRPNNGLDKQRMVRFFMQHSDANALLRIDLVEIRLDPTRRLRQFRGEWCDLRKDVLGATAFCGQAAEVIDESF